MEEINKLLQSHIEEFEINSMDDFLFQKNCSSIVLSNKTRLYVPNYKKRYTFEQSFKLSLDFLSTISKEYSDRLIERRNEGAFIVDYGTNPIYPTSRSLKINDKNIIYILFDDTIHCSYNISHEFIHDTTIIGAEESVTRNIFCEVPSTYIELLQDKYLEGNKHIDACVWQRDRINTIYFKALCMSFELKLIEKYIENGYINNQILTSVFKTFDYNQTILYHYLYMLETDKFYWVEDQRHVWGFLIANYMMIKEEEMCTNHREFIELNEMINTFNENQFLSYIDLERTSDFNVFDLTNDSYMKIRNSYIKYLKKIR